MPAATDQLTEIFAEIQDVFSAHPHIEVRPTRGNPPDQYEVRYRIISLKKDESSEIVETDDLAVEIAIPFGFPHFPPSCKPKCTVFHPDFDPAAICLGDFWETSPSLPELIIHIGKMLNGEFFSKDNAFDEDAATWYANHLDRFPLSSIRWQVNDVFEGNGGSMEPVLDILDDQDLALDLDIDNNDLDDFSLESTPSSTSAETDLSLKKRLKRLQELLKQKKLYTLSKINEDGIPFSEEEQSLLADARTKVAIAKKNHQQGIESEENGKPAEALGLYQKIGSNVSDFPGIATDIRRVEQSVSLLNELELATEEPSPSLEKDNQKTKQTPKKKAKSPATDKNAVPRTPAKPRTAGTKNNRAIGFGLLFCLLALGGGAAYLFFSAGSSLQSAQSTFLKCQKELADKSFQKANAACTQARTSLDGVRFIKQTQKQELFTKINTIMGSEEFKQGLQGKVLHNGVYIPQKEAQQLFAIESHLSMAEELFTQERWKEAQDAYSALLTQLKTIPSQEDNIRLAQQRLLLTQYHSLVQVAATAFSEGKWSKTLEILKDIKPFLAKLDDEFAASQNNRLQEMQLTSQLQILKTKADTYFSGADWDHAIEAYRELFTIGPGSTSVGEEKVSDIQVRLVKAQLYRTVSQGNQSFAEGSWNSAINAYEKASALLLDNKKLLGEPQSLENYHKLARVILQAQTIRDKQQAQQLLKKGNKKKARRLFADIHNRVQQSTFNQDEEFQAVLQETGKRLKELDKEIFFAGKEQYLRDNYKKLFAANYPVSSLENLIRPVIVFAREQGSQVIFKMQCTETGRGRPLNLVMYYSWDRKSRSWSLFAGELP